MATGSEEVFKVNAKMAATQITPIIEARIFQVDVILMIWGHEPVSLALEYPLLGDASSNSVPVAFQVED